jgi:hypothetical protein
VRESVTTIAKELSLGGACDSFLFFRKFACPEKYLTGGIKLPVVSVVGDRSGSVGSCVGDVSVGEGVVILAAGVLTVFGDGAATLAAAVFPAGSLLLGDGVTGLDFNEGSTKLSSSLSMNELTDIFFLETAFPIAFVMSLRIGWSFFFVFFSSLDFVVFDAGTIISLGFLN